MKTQLRGILQYYIYGLCLLAGFVQHGCVPRRGTETAQPSRIVSLAPNITEILFALGLGEKVLGVTNYCTHPPEAAAKEKIGNYADPNCERIVTLRPDLVVLSAEHEKQRLYLERFGIRTLPLDCSTIAGVCSSFAAIGRVCGAPEAADSMVRLFGNALAPARTHDGSAPKILFCVGRDAPGAGRITGVYAAGKATFYHDLIKAAGGRNAFPDSFPAYPKLSAEGILALAPDIIIDVAPAMESCACSLLVRDWQAMTRVPAVAEGMIYCMEGAYATVPGPRLLLLLRDLERMIDKLYQGRADE